MNLNSLTDMPGLALKIFNEAPASMIVIDKKGKVLAVNRGFSLYTSKPGREMVGRMLLGSKEISDPKLLKKYRTLLKSGKPFFGHVLKHQATLQNRWYTMSLSAVPLKDINNKVVGAISIAQDITSLVDTQQKLEVANKSLQRRVEDYAAELMEKQRELAKSFQSRNNFFADASHELRTPLTIIKGNVDLILLKSQDHTLPLSFRKSLQDINMEAVRMSRLLEDITTLNRGDLLVEPRGLSLIYFDQVVRNVLQGFLVLAKSRKVKIISHISAVQVLAEEGCLNKVVNNLVSNALRYTEKNGKINVRLFQMSGKAILEVKDTGIGINKKDISHVFDRFYRADQARQRVSGGTGLGLTICKYIVQRNHGTIAVKSTIGKGSTFRVSFPCAQKVQS